MAGEYEPRYRRGDCYSDGLGILWEITAVRRASVGDGISSIDAIERGFTVYRARTVDGARTDVKATRFLHEMVDKGYRGWAYLGPAAKAESGGRQ